MKRGELTEVLAGTMAFGVSQYVSREFMRHASFNVEEWAERAALKLQTRVCSHNLRETQVRYPADWWEAFKDRFFPKWALKRWPVRYKVERIELHAVFPDLPIPDKGEHFLHARTFSEGVET